VSQCALAFDACVWFIYVVERLCPALLSLIVLLAGPPVAFSDEDATDFDPVLVVHARADKPEYVLGEPVRFIVALVNMSPDSVYLGSCDWFYSVRRAGATVEHWEGDDGAPRGIIPPLDSLLFFADPSMITRRAEGGGQPVGFVYAGWTFSHPGDYRLRVVCRPLAGDVRGFCCRACLSEQTVVSNEIRLTVRRPTRNEARVLDALRGLWRINRFRAGAEDQIVRMLDEVDPRIPSNELSPYLSYAATGMLLSRYLPWVPERMPQVIDALERLDRIQHDFPHFLPDDVAYWRAMAELHLASTDSLAGDWRRSARDEFAALVNHQPGLVANPDYARLNARVRETGDDVLIRLITDKHDYLLGEPMLLQVSIVNRSSRQVRVPHPFWLAAGAAGFCGWVQIEKPDGTETLKTYVYSTAHYGQRFGVALAPNDSLIAVWGPQIVSSSSGSAGEYQLSAGFEVRASDWTIWGAGRLHLSAPVRVTFRQADARAARILGALANSSSGPYFWSREDMPAVYAAFEADPNHPLAFHLQRRIARDECARDEFDSAISRYDVLERSLSGMWHEDVSVDLLRTYSWAWSRADPRRAASHAEPLIARLSRENPAMWTDARFFTAVLNAWARPSQLDHGCWAARLSLLGVKPPSWDELHELMRGPDYGPGPPRGRKP